MEIFFHHLFATRADPVLSLTCCARDKYAGHQRKPQISTHDFSSSPAPVALDVSHRTTGEANNRQERQKGACQPSHRVLTCSADGSLPISLRSPMRPLLSPLHPVRRPS